jgi:DNA-binding response OmpR family regulator
MSSPPVSSVGGPHPVLLDSALIIEDEPDIAELLSQHLGPITRRLEVCGTSSAARRRVAAGPVDLVLLDLNLPDGDGLDLCRYLRRSPTEPLVIMLTARTEEAARVCGFDAGADDYLCKPFSIRELMARIGALVRRDQRRAFDGPPHEPLAVRDLVLDSQRRTAQRAGTALELSPREFDLLWFLASRADRIYSREQLLTAVWGPRFEGFEHTVNAHINRLRTKLDPDRSRPHYIITVWGAGYRFAQQPEGERGLP